MPEWRNGRRRGFKIPRRKACRFESDLGHQHPVTAGAGGGLGLGTAGREPALAFLTGLLGWWIVDAAWPVLIMEGVPPENVPFVWLSRFVMLAMRNCVVAETGGPSSETAPPRTMVRGARPSCVTIATTAGTPARCPLSQYSPSLKRTTSRSRSVEEIRSQINPMGVPDFEAVAIEGTGVFETLKAVSKMVVKNLS